MSSNQLQSDNQAPLQVSLKAKPSQKTKQIAKTRASKTQKQDSSQKLATLKKKLKSQLKKQFQQDKIRQQLQKMPLNLGRSNFYSDQNEIVEKNQIIKIQDNINEKKKIRGIGVEVVQMNRRMVRKPDEKFMLKLDLTNRMRGNFQEILGKKKARR